jgi:MFS transporter, ACS family, tartrate transporter
MSILQPNLNLVDPDFGRQALRKISFRLIPLLAVCYGVSYIDRVNVSFAALQMNRDLHFSASVYGFGAGVFFLSYALCEIPSNLLLVRFGARRWIARIMITWGVLAALMMFVKTPLEFYVLRFLLGMAEAGFFPGVVYYLTLWFPQGSRSRAISRFYIAIPISGMLMASLSGLLLGLQGRLGLAGWQWLFLVEALPAIALGFVIFRMLPDGPADATWLSALERRWLEDSLQQESTAKKNLCHVTLRSALRDPRIWQIGIFLLINFSAAYAYAFTAPLLIRELTGFSNTAIGLIVAAISFCVGVAVIINGLAASNKQPSYLYILIPSLLISLGCLGVGLFRTPLLVICSLGLITIFHNASFGPLYAIVASFLDKKAVAGGLALVTTIGIVGGFLGPYYIGLAKDLAGSYQKGFLALSIPCFFAAFLALNLHRMQRRKRSWPVVIESEAIAELAS